MKLLRYGPPGQEKPGLQDGKIIRDLSGVIDDFAGVALAPDNLARIAKIDPESLPKVEGNPRIGPPVKPREVFAIGLNYALHAAEAGVKVPPEPIVFNKTCPLTGPNDDIVIPRGAQKCDWEVELVFVMGRKAQHVNEKDALSCIAGYSSGNDVSERSYQLERAGQWIKGKSSDTFGPMGPWLVTADEVKNPQKLDLWLKVNGETYQKSNTADMIFSCAQIVAAMSSMITLYPGDVVYTGTPSGVGLGIKPKPVFLKPGDVITMGVQGLGEHKNKVLAWKKGL